MTLRLLILLTQPRLYYALLEFAAFVFVLLATVRVARAEPRGWLKFLVPISLGLGLEPLARLVRLAAEVVTSGPYLPVLVYRGEIYLSWAGRVVLIYGAFLLYRGVKVVARPCPPSERLPADESVWPPPVGPVK